MEVNGDDDDNRDKDAGAQHFVAARQSLQLAAQSNMSELLSCNQSQEMEFDVHSSWQRQGWPAMGFSYFGCNDIVLPWQFVANIATSHT